VVIAAAVETNFAQWKDSPPRRHHGTGDPLPDYYPYQRQLDAVHAGAAVNVSTGDLPVNVRASLDDSGCRVVVAPDDSVTVSDDDSLPLWMEEAGLLYDGHAEQLRI
jgi:hypothetical protein